MSDREQQIQAQIAIIGEAFFDVIIEEAKEYPDIEEPVKILALIDLAAETAITAGIPYQDFIARVVAKYQGS